ncbi:ArsR/SmtB family transcription factor [Microbacterium phyllosphaerae]|uniref:ArsR/SmtB family transcription factor n=1 Tax=Microbacterium phyllosphaerae TaxID=124798 RepID=UPI003D6466D7
MRTVFHPALEDVKLHEVMHALGSPVRLAVVRGLLDGGIHQGSEFDLGVSQSTMSHHVKILREAGIVQNDPQGTRCLLSLRTTELESRFPGLVEQLRILLPHSVNDGPCQ